MWGNGERCQTEETQIKLGLLPVFLSFLFLKTDTMTNRLPSTSTTMVVMSTLARRLSVQGKDRLSWFPREDEAFLRGASVSSTILTSCCDWPDGSTCHNPAPRWHIQDQFLTGLGQRARVTVLQKAHERTAVRAPEHWSHEATRAISPQGGQKLTHGQLCSAVRASFHSHASLRL